MNKPVLIGCIVCWIGACAPGPEGLELEMRVSAQSTETCTPEPSRGLPAEVDRVVLQLRDVAGEWQTRGEVARDGGQGSLVEKVPTGDAELRLVACVGRTASHVARIPPTSVASARKRALVAHFRPLAALSCAGTGFGPNYDQFAALPAANAFGTAIGLGDQLLLAGGANAIFDLRMQGQDTGKDWSIFDWREALFWPGLAREIPLSRRPLDVARVGLRAARYRLGERTGVLFLGGAPALELTTPPAVPIDGYQAGPLRPADDAVAETPLAFFDPVTGATAPIETTTPLTPRVLAGVGQVDDGRVVRVGGLAVIDGAHTPSDAVEVIGGAQVRAARMPAPLLGASVTPAGGDALVVWGADTAACGATPGYLVTLDPVLAATPLTFPGDTPPACDDVCRSWYASAYHTATPLQPDAAGNARVLIVGGLVVRGDDLLPNPDPGGQCAPNAFVLTVNPTTAEAFVRPVEVSPSADTAVRRALHRATSTNRRVLISGGWGSFGKPTSFVAGDEVLFYDDGDPVGQISAGSRMVIPRLGHVAAALPEGRVLLAGGAAPRAVELDAAGNATVVEPLRLNTLAEIYTPELAVDPCPKAVDDAEPAPE